MIRVRWTYQCLARHLQATVVLTLLGLSVLGSSGCAAVGFIGAMIEEDRKHKNKVIEAEYVGLEGKTFAVIVSADRIIQSEYPGLIERVTQRMTTQLADGLSESAAGYLPASDVLLFQYNNPDWAGFPLGELADKLGVERLVHVELREYQLYDPGNEFLWDGIAAGTIAVIEADSALPDDFAFERIIRVTYPDGSGYGPDEVPYAVVNSELSRRFYIRAAWLMYQHEEPYYPEF